MDNGLSGLNASREMNARVKGTELQDQRLVTAVPFHEGCSRRNVLDTPFREIVERNDIVTAK
jgi:hypothetical protein